jgi:biopolymer transport protein ExbD
MAILYNPGQSRGVGFPLAPMIDMIFLLLVFFMTVSTLSLGRQAVEVVLPQAQASPLKPNRQQTTLTLSRQADGQLFLGGQAVTLTDLPALLSGLRRTHPDLHLNLRLSDDTPYAQTQPLLEACAKAGIEDINYATHPLSLKP